MTKSVLIVSYHYPPSPSIAGFTAVKLAKYLPMFGWRPLILTAEFNEERHPAPEIDGAFVRRTKDVFSLISPAFKKCGRKGFSCCGLNEALAIIKNERPQLLFSTAGPVRTHLLSSRIQRASGLLWVCDYQDLWSGNLYQKKRLFQEPPFITGLKEQAAMKNVSYFVSVSEAWAQDLSRRHNKPAACIYNGFDEDNYELPVTLTEKFTVTFTGGLYWGKRDPSVLFAAVKELKDMGVVNARNFEVRFYGDDCLQLKSKVDLLGLGDVVSIEGGIAHQEAILRQRESTVLLQLNWDDARDKGWYTGKMCEYLGARRPILSLHTLGGTLEEKFLKASGAGVVCMSALEIKDVLLKWIGIFRDKGSLDWDVDEKWIKPFKFKEQARQYADVFDLVVS